MNNTWTRPLGNFWFADIADEDSEFAGYWQAFLQTPGMCTPLPIGFQDEDAAMEFIRTEIMTAKADYEPPEGT